MSFAPTTLTSIMRAQVSANIEVPNEPVGVLDGCNLKFDDKGAALGQVIVVPVVPPVTLGNASPSNVPPSGNSVTPVNMQVTITNVPEASQVLTGEDLRQLDTIEAREDTLKQFIAQSQRAIRNQMSAAAASALTVNGSRGVGVIGTVPFTNGISSLNAARTILRKNGAPMADVQVATSPEAYQNLLNLNVFQKAQENGGSGVRLTGVIPGQSGFSSIREDANIADHTAGAGTGYTLNGTHAKGVTALVLTGGTVNATGIQIGDSIKIAGDSNQYMVVPAPGTSTQYQTPSASNLLATSGTIYIGNPGLMKTINSGAAVTVLSGTTVNGVTGYTPSFVFERHALVGIIRPPIQPTPNMHYNILETITDKFGYTYLFGEANQNFQVSWFVWAAYGFAVTQSEFIVPILGQ